VAPPNKRYLDSSVKREVMSAHRTPFLEALRASRHRAEVRHATARGSGLLWPRHSIFRNTGCQGMSRSSSVPQAQESDLFDADEVLRALSRRARTGPNGPGNHGRL